MSEDFDRLMEMSDISWELGVDRPGIVDRIGPARPVFPGTGGWANQPQAANPIQRLPIQGAAPTFSSNRAGNLMSFSDSQSMLAGVRGMR